jgi:hypothetical protein
MSRNIIFVLMHHRHKLLDLIYSRISQYFMELEMLLLASQEPAIGPYPEPDESIPYDVTLFL